MKIITISLLALSLILNGCTPRTVNEPASAEQENIQPEEQTQPVAEEEKQEQEQAEPTEIKEELQVTESTQTEPEPLTTNLSALEKELTEVLASYEGEWAVYVEDLNTKESFSIHNKKMVAASLIKLFIMGAVYQEIEAGTIQKDDVSNLLFHMITVSDNEASNKLVSILGGGTYTDMKETSFQEGLKKVNAYAASIQCPDTEQQRDMKNSRPNPIPEENFTSVCDCGTLLRRLYRGELVSEAADKEMLGLLKQQTRTWKIPSGLPSGTPCANKTGELSHVENDVAIVFSPAGDYVLCVMSNHVPSTGTAQKQVSSISKTVYEFFN